MTEAIERTATPAIAAQHPRLMDRVRASLRVAHYALSTERLVQVVIERMTGEGAS